jgi:hypothetical protein
MMQQRTLHPHVSLVVMSGNTQQTHYLYPLNPKSEGGFVLREGTKVVPTSRDGFFQVVEYNTLDKWGVAKNANKIKIGDFIWVHFALPHSHLGAVGIVEREARWESAWGRAAIWIRWDGELTEKLRRNPIPLSKYRQVPQFSATTANPRAAKVLSRWLNAKRTPKARDLESKVHFRTAEVEQRVGQPEFRAELLHAYRNRCAISGCAIPEVLQAAHIQPVKSSGSHSVVNGLLLRADLHNLFDRGLLTVNAKYVVRFDSVVMTDPAYRRLHAKRLRVLPESVSERPSRKLLQRHQDFHTNEVR